jgi:hypothetical protein
LATRTRPDPEKRATSAVGRIRNISGAEGLGRVGRGRPFPDRPRTGEGGEPRIEKDDRDYRRPRWYSNGFLTREQFDRLRETHKIRDQVVHGLIPPDVDPELVRYVVETTKVLMNE